MLRYVQDNSPKRAFPISHALIMYFFFVTQKCPISFKNLGHF
jgi:hypothetical protein